MADAPKSKQMAALIVAKAAPKADEGHDEMRACVEDVMAAMKNGDVDALHAAMKAYHAHATNDYNQDDDVGDGDRDAMGTPHSDGNDKMKNSSY